MHESAPERALSWLRAQIGAGTWNPSHVLPSLDLLAKQAHVSRHSLWKAMGVLKTEGVIRVRRGSPAMVRTPADAPAKNATMVQDIADQIVRAIQQGEFMPGFALPTSAKLQARWRANYRTIRKALQCLARQGMLTSTGSRYHVPRMRGSAGSLEILFINEGLSSGNPALVSMLQIAERISQKMGIRFVRFKQSFSETCDTILLKKLLARNAMTGIIIDCWGLGSPDRIVNFRSFISMLYSSRKQVSIINHAETIDFPEPLKSSSRIRIFSIAGKLAGEAIGRLLLDAGHRKAAFLTTVPDQEWSQFRCAGLRRAFEIAGFPAQQVVEFHTSPLPDIIPLICATGRLSERESRELYAQQMPEAAFRRMAAYTAEITRSFKLEQKETDLVRKQVRTVLALNKTAGQTVSDATRLRILDDLGARLYRRYLHPMFKKVLSDSSITAWVSVNDSIGLEASTFLEEHSVPVPENISLVAFDNGVESTVRNLTSYDFDLQNLFPQALSFAIGRPGKAASSKHSVECAGTLIERRTTGRARPYCRYAQTPP